MNLNNRSLVFLFVGFTLLAMGISSGISFVYSYGQFKVNTESQLSARADAYGHELNAIIQTVETAVDTVKSNLEVSLDVNSIQSPDYFESIQPHLEALARQFDQNDIYTTSFYVRFDPKISSGTSGVFHADTNGDGLMETQTPTDLSQYPATDIEHVGWFYIPMALDSGAWMAPYYNANIQTYMVSYVAPIKLEGQAIGIVGMDVDFSTLKKIADNHQGAGKVVLLDANYAFMVHDTYTLKDRLDTLDGGQLTFMKEAMALNSHGTLHYKLGGLNKVLGYSRLVNHWTVIVALSEEEAFDSFNRTTSTLLWINITVALIITAISIAFSGYVHRLVTANSNLSSEVADRTRQLQETNEYLEETVAELENQQAELTLVNQQLEDAMSLQREMQSQLIEKEKLRSLAELIASIAHELNTPVGNAIALNSFLNEQIIEIQRLVPSKPLLDPEISTAITSLSESCQLSSNTLERIAGIVEHFKLLTNPQNSIDVKRINLQQLVTDLLTPFQSQLQREQHLVHLEIDADLTILTSEIVIKQVLNQLISNALIHGLAQREHSVLTLKCYRSAQLIYLVVQDNGKGMSEAVLKRALNPFFTTRQNKGSVGLGLHIVHNLISQALNGTLTLESTPDTGTTVTIVFPEFSH